MVVKGCCVCGEGHLLVLNGAGGFLSFGVDLVGFTDAAAIRIKRCLA